jgi:hypothetical protein
MGKSQAVARMGMGVWQILHKNAYNLNFIELNRDLQRFAIQAIFEVKNDSITSHGTTIK